MAAAHVPRLAGQSAEYLQKQLEDFASGTRDNSIMRNFAKQLSKQRRAQIAAQYAGMTAGYLPQPNVPSEEQLSRGRKLAFQGDKQSQIQACDSCHGPDGGGVLHAAPYLAGQFSEYIASSLRAFQTETRKNDGGQLMRSVAQRLSDADISAVSEYFSQARTAQVTPSFTMTRSP
jgi:cytochrome c553